MDPQSRQAALDNITPEELEKVKAHQASTAGALPVDNEWMLLAEFALAFGWDAYKDARDDGIKSDEMLTLIAAKRKLDSLAQYRAALASFIGAGSAQTKKPSQTFSTLTRKIINDTKADD